MPTFPTIHLNGSDGETLLAQYLAALKALQAAAAAHDAASPNARDYYVQGPDAYAAAREEHVNRAQRLASITAELEAICIRVSDDV
jgi:hypothetical protein